MAEVAKLNDLYIVVDTSDAVSITDRAIVAPIDGMISWAFAKDTLLNQEGF